MANRQRAHVGAPVARYAVGDTCDDLERAVADALLHLDETDTQCRAHAEMRVTVSGVGTSRDRKMWLSLGEVTSGSGVGSALTSRVSEIVFSTGSLVVSSTS
jgi:hypothetical protein